MVSVYGDGDAPLFSARVAQTGLTTSVLELAEDVAQLDQTIRQEGLDPARFRDRWLADRAPNLRARIIARPVSSGMGVTLPASNTVPIGLREALRAQIEQEPALFAGQESASPVRVSVVGNRLRIEPTDPGAVDALSVAAELRAIPEVIGQLRRLAKSRALLDLAETLQASGLSNDLKFELVLRSGARLLDGTCQVGATRRIDTVVPEVRDCDEVEIHLINNGTQALDLTPLYLAADHQIYFLTGYDGSAEGGLRLAPGENATLRYTEVTENAGAGLATGRMHLMFLAVLSDGSWPPKDFRHLQEIAPPPLTRTAGADPLTQLLNSAAFGLRLRSTVTPRDSGSAGAVVIPLRTVGNERVVQVND